MLVSQPYSRTWVPGVLSRVALLVLVTFPTPGKDSRQIVTLANVGLLELSRCEAQTIRVILEILIAGALLTDQRYIYDAMSYSLCCRGA